MLRRLIPPVATAFSLAVATGGIVWLKPGTRHFETCVLHWATGYHCPACGGTRAVEALAHGDLARAWQFNQLFVALVPLLALVWIDWLILAARGRPYRPIPHWLAWGGIGVLVAFGVVRNLPGFEYLRPQ